MLIDDDGEEFDWASDEDEREQRDERLAAIDALLLAPKATEEDRRWASEDELRRYSHTNGDVPLLEESPLSVWQQQEVAAARAQWRKEAEYAYAMALQEAWVSSYDPYEDAYQRARAAGYPDTVADDYAVGYCREMSRRGSRRRGSNDDEGDGYDGLYTTFDIDALMNMDML